MANILIYIINITTHEYRKQCRIVPSWLYQDTKEFNDVRIYETIFLYDINYIMRKDLPKITQNLVFLKELPTILWKGHEISVKAGYMCLNRLCIDEDDSFELSGVYHLKRPSKKEREEQKRRQTILRRNAKGKVNYCD